MGVADWRAWTAQNGGQLVTAPNPPGTPYIPNSPFPGVGPIPDLINGPTSLPPYPNTPTVVNAVDPWGGWTDQQELSVNSGGAHAPVMRPPIAGITSP